MPRSSTPATPAVLALTDQPDTAFRPECTAPAFATMTDFGAQSSRPALSLCTLRTRQSPGGMATLATDLPAPALAGPDLHRLGPNRKFHSLMCDPLSPRFPQREHSLSPCRDDAIVTAGMSAPHRLRHPRGFEFNRSRTARSQSTMSPPYHGRIQIPDLVQIVIRVIAEEQSPRHSQGLSKM
jgi:hypothetical protein